MVSSTAEAAQSRTAVYQLDKFPDDGFYWCPRLQHRFRAGFTAAARLVRY